MRITGAIFDMDGTLLDTMGAWATVGERYLQSRGITPLGIEQDSLMVLSMKEVARHYQRTYGLQEDERTIIDGIYEQMAQKCLKSDGNRVTLKQEASRIVCEAMKGVDGS